MNDLLVLLLESENVADLLLQFLLREDSLLGPLNGLVDFGTELLLLLPSFLLLLLLSVQFLAVLLRVDIVLDLLVGIDQKLAEPYGLLVEFSDFELLLFEQPFLFFLGYLELHLQGTLDVRVLL